MKTLNISAQKILLLLLKNQFSEHTASSLANYLKMSRWGIWKILKKLQSIDLIILKPIGTGKTNTYTVNLNWNNILTEKTLSLYLTQESLKQQRWRSNLADLEKETDFLILYGSILHSPKKANDIDIICVTAQKSKLVKIKERINKIQKTTAKEIHLINLTNKEFKKELKIPNEAFLDAIQKGIIIFGQDNFVRFIKELKT